MRFVIVNIDEPLKQIRIIGDHQSIFTPNYHFNLVTSGGVSIGDVTVDTSVSVGGATTITINEPLSGVSVNDFIVVGDYVINQADGIKEFSMRPFVFNNTETSLILPGHGTLNYGEPLIENMVQMLEHFSSATPPIQPIRGQQWYNETVEMMMIYNGTDWISSSTVFSGPVPPAIPHTEGLMWFDTSTVLDRPQLMIYNGTLWNSVAEHNVLKSGDVMTGLLELSGDPINNRHAVTKQYVDTHINDQTVHITPNQNTLLDGLNLPTLTSTEVNYLIGTTGIIQDQLDDLVSDLTDHTADVTVHMTPLQNTLLDGLNLPTLTSTEVNYLIGTTGIIQDQLDAITTDLSDHGSDTTIHLTPTQNTLLDGINATITSSEINYLDGASSNIQTQLNGKESTANKGVPNGYAALGVDGKIPQGQVPAIAITDTFVVGTELDMLALMAETGDVAVRTDLSKSFILKGTSPSVLLDWQELLTPTDSVGSVNGLTGVVTLTKVEIGLGNVDNTSDVNKPISTLQQDALDLKAPIESPTFTGIPLSTTAAVNTNTTQIATTAFVNAEIANDAAPITHVGTGGTAHAPVVAAGDAGFMTGADKTKLDGIAAGATNYVHPATDGNLHVPATGTTNNGKVLSAGATAGSLSWVDIPSASVTSVAGKTGVVDLVKGDVGLGSVDNTSDANKPISTLQQDAFDLKAPIESPTFTGTVGGITHAMVGAAPLVHNHDTSYVSLSGGDTVTGTLTINGTLTLNTAPSLPAHAATKQYVDDKPLPIASSTVLGGIKVGANLSVAPDGTLSADTQSGTTSGVCAETVEVQILRELIGFGCEQELINSITSTLTAL